MPPAFQPLVLPAPVAQVRQLLFGSGPDRAYLNYRLRELMGTLHASELAGHVLALDPRVTYLPFGRDLFDLVAGGAVVTTLVDTGQSLLFAGGRWPVPSGQRLRFQWQLTVLDATTVRLVYEASAGLVTADQAYTMAGGLSSMIFLPGSNLAVCFSAGVGGSWRVDALARPFRPLPEVAATVERGLTGDMADAVFGPRGAPEPYQTFRNCWECHDQFPYRLGGLAAALAYRTNDLGA